MSDVEQCPQVSGMHLSENAESKGYGMVIECARPAKHTGWHTTADKKMRWSGKATEREMAYAERLRSAR